MINRFMANDIKQGIFVGFRYAEVKATLPNTPPTYLIILLSNHISYQDKELITNCGFIHHAIRVSSDANYIADDEIHGWFADDIFRIVITSPEELNLFKISFDHFIVDYKAFSDI